MAEITVKGLDKLEKKLQKNRSLADVKMIVKTHGGQLQRNMMRKSPVDTGNMRRSIHMQVVDSGMTVIVGPSAEYAPYVEYGTRFMNAQPFVRPALDEQKQQFKSDLNKIMK